MRMEKVEYYCSACNSLLSVDDIDIKRRTGKCPWCGHVTKFEKPKSTASLDALASLNKASELFFASNFDAASQMANHVLTLTDNGNFAALYIVHYIDLIKKGNKPPFFKLMHNDLDEAILEDDEEQLLKNLIYKTAPNTIEYECEILNKFEEYDDDEELTLFVEKYSPFALSKRVTFEWLTPKMIDVYKRIVSRVKAPKLLLGLYNSMLKNPESPLSDDSFFVIKKTERIYNNVILPLEDVFSNIGDNETKEKFYPAYLKVKSVYTKKMNEQL